ncbi:MAG: ABC-F type ribosomal protection protein [Marinisporobacter sp.]|jgi:macrolide transport system ATP-binding/permease protein|nr:ABC-F type ribosomal protection protein [Marinisporobacter sp.]
MLRIEMNDVKKYYGERLILEIKNIRIYDKDRIGIVGINGAGKSTLLQLLTEKIQPDIGWVKKYGTFSYISQLDYVTEQKIDERLNKDWNLPTNISDSMSGGEKTRYKIAQAFTQETNILFADEPTANLDIKGIEQLENQMKQYQGTILVVSHDRKLLDCICNKILEIQDEQIKIYSGNYSMYLSQKQKAKKRELFKYEQYHKQKRKLKTAIAKVQNQSKSMKKTPKRMGNSEARLHRKMGNQKAKKKLDQTVKAMHTRLEHLEIKKKPIDLKQVKFDLNASETLHSKILIEGKKINQCFGEKVIFKSADFQIQNKTKTALLGENGCGKTTLINMIIHNKQQIQTSKTLKIGYFRQDLQILDKNKTIFENILQDSNVSEALVRTTLARLLFKKDDVYKKVSCLSGGERVKVSFAKLITSDVNMLILDEPTNYLDIYSTTAMENILKEYEGTILFVSHDRKLIQEVATHIMVIHDHKIKQFHGGYEAYLQSLKNSKTDRREEEEKKMILENRLAQIVSRLSVPKKTDNIEALDLEYHQILKSLHQLKNRTKHN